MWWWNVQGWWSFGTQFLAAAITLAVFGFALAGLYFVVTYLRTKDQTPADILARRFASGEIDEDEYRSRLRVLDETTERTPQRASV